MAAAVATGTPVTGFAPVATEVILAMGSPCTSLLTAVEAERTPAHMGPLTGEVKVATGNPCTKKLTAVPVTMSPVAEVPVVIMMGVGMAIFSWV